LIPIDIPTSNAAPILANAIAAIPFGTKRLAVAFVEFQIAEVFAAGDHIRKFIRETPCAVVLFDPVSIEFECVVDPKRSGKAKLECFEILKYFDK
jgi:hypothetical protein